MPQAGSTFTPFPIPDVRQFKTQLLNWATSFNVFCFLDSHHYRLSHSSAQCILAAGEKRHVAAFAGAALPELERLVQNGRWLFGHLGYDLKNEITNAASHHPDFIDFPDLYFFEPEVVITLVGDEVRIFAPLAEAQEIYTAISAAGRYMTSQYVPEISARFSHTEYIDTVQQLQQHLLRGDCYEINFCQEFYANHIAIDPLSVFESLSQASPNPFSAFYRVNDKYLLCSSPERFLKKEGNKILSQPIKGTWSRNLHDVQQDVKNRNYLLESKKDRAENVMVVDLVRNDLAKICLDGTVAVEELFGIYAFPQVYQMISTVTGELRAGLNFTDMVRATFPMGSMTGAPKQRVMELIEQYEKTKRGIFSGALGYISPLGDFDFNVVIRSILYNATSQYLSYSAGSGITFYSDPETEYEECLLKAAAIKKVLTGKVNTF